MPSQNGIEIEFKQWGVGPDREDLGKGIALAVPRVGDTVVFFDASYEVRKVEWIFTGGDDPRVIVWLA